MSAYITATGICLPNEPVSNENIESVLGQIGDHPSRVKDVILRSNKIRSRFYAIDPETHELTHTNAQLTTEAVFAMMEAGDMGLDDIALLACGTSTPDQLIPSHAAMVHGLLGCPPCEILSTSGVCCSGVSALKYAMLSVAAGTTSSAVVTGSDLPSPRLTAAHFRSQAGPATSSDAAPGIAEEVTQDPYLAFENDFLRWMLSDGAGALRVENKPRDGAVSLRLDWIELTSFANELESCMYAGALKNPDGSLRPWMQELDLDVVCSQGYLSVYQDVRLLKANIVPVVMRRSLEHVIRKYEIRSDQLDWVLPHLSSYFFERPVRRMLGEIGFEVPEEKWFTNLADKGNTGAASLFIMLDDLRRSGRLESGQRLLAVVPESARFTFAYLHMTVE